MTSEMMSEMTISEWDEVPERSVDFDDFEKFKDKVLGVFECIYEENLFHKPCDSRIKYLIETFPNMKTQVLIDILSFAVKNEYDEYCDDELDNFIFNIYEYN